MALFGSYARGDYNNDSDIDILVDFSASIDGFQFIRLAHELEDLFDQKADVVSRNEIRPAYLPYVEKILSMSERETTIYSSPSIRSRQDYRSPNA